VGIAAALITALGGIVVAYINKQPMVDSARPEVSQGSKVPSSTDTGRFPSTFPAESDKKIEPSSVGPPPRRAAETMRPGQYRLISINGGAQFGTEMVLTKLSDDHFTARAASATGVVHTDLRRDRGSSWFVRLVDPTTGLGVGEAVANEVSAQGSRLSFSSQLGAYVWERTAP
jgi:hypothetical protein